MASEVDSEENKAKCRVVSAERSLKSVRANDNSGPLWEKELGSLRMGGQRLTFSFLNILNCSPCVFYADSIPWGGGKIVSPFQMQFHFRKLVIFLKCAMIYPPSVDRFMA